jgi:benzylsuccinate CoA-transferase BbsE subunit
MSEAAAKAQPAPQALSGLRVLDLSGLAGQYCGKLFADLGADVILVEPPGGSQVRRDGPFLDGRAHPEYSLTFGYLNAGKRAIGLDLDHPEGQRVLKALAATADLVIESDKPGVAARRGLDAASLRAQSPRLVVTSITPFGQTGPFAYYESEELIALALGGLLYLGGYADTAPMAAAGNLAHLAAAQFAAVASMTALWASEGPQGQGRHVDVSIQECVVMAMENAIQFFDLEGTVRKREAGQQKLAGMGVFDCLDGQVYLMAGGISSGSFWQSTTQWLVDAGVPGAVQLAEPTWSDADYLATDEAKTLFARLFGPFAAARTKEQLYREGQSRRIPICPIQTPADLVGDRQLAHRGFFVPMQHPASGRILTVPGAPYALSKTPWRLAGMPPRLGEHTAQVLGELGFGPAEMAALLQSGVIH